MAGKAGELMVKPVSLTVHRNTLERRKRRQMREEMVHDAKRLSRDSPISGYAIVTWTEGYDFAVSWDTGKAIPSYAMPDFVRNALMHKVQERSLANACEPEPEPETS